MKTKYLITLFLASTIVASAQTTLTNKNFVAFDLVGKLDNKMGDDYIYSPEYFRSGQIGIIPSFGWSWGKNGFLRLEFGYVFGRDTTYESFSSTNKYDIVSESVLSNAFVLGFGFTKFIPLSNTKCFITADMGVQLTNAFLTSRLSYGEVGNSTYDNGSGSRIEMHLGIAPGFAFFVSQNMLLGFNYGFLGLSSSTAYLYYDNGYFNKDNVATTTHVNFNTSTLQIRFIHLLDKKGKQ